MKNGTEAFPGKISPSNYRDPINISVFNTLS